jgi:intracellular septation protein A
MLWLTILAEYAVVDPDGPMASRARLFLTALTYVLAVLLFGLIWNTRARSMISATLTLLAAGSLAFDLLYASGAQLSRVFMFSLSIGLVLAEGNWAINYWRSNVFIAAMAQLFAFYALTGLAGQHLLHRINRRVLIEFGVVMGLALLLLLWGRL